MIDQKLDNTGDAVRLARQILEIDKLAIDEVDAHITILELAEQVIKDAQEGPSDQF